DHDHDHHHDHHHGEACGAVDPHLWLDPVLVQQVLPEIWESLPSDLRASEAALEQALARVAAVDRAHRERLVPFDGAVIVTHHAAFPRLAERYGLEVATVIRPITTSEPSPEQVAAVRRAVDERGVGAIFVEPQYDADLAERLARDAGCSVGVVDPLADDWFAMMDANLDVFVGTLGVLRDDVAAAVPTAAEE
ncbi:MAG: metal ABC transporter substrate-binding protein, partial [Planctomycetota bacterium]